MKVELRRQEILSFIGNSDHPVPANVLSETFAVSRQVIVQDIAMLRAAGYDVLATNKGYVLNVPTQAVRVFKCRHNFEQIVDEGNLVLSLGGRIDDVFVNHRVYGKISARLDLTTPTHVEELYRSLRSGVSKPLMSVTDGYHYHTVSATDEQALNAIESALRTAGFLVEI